MLFCLLCRNPSWMLRVSSLRSPYLRVWKQWSSNAEHLLGEDRIMLVESILIWHMGLSKIGRFTPNNFGFTKIIGITVKRDINPSNYWPNCARVGPKMVDIQDTATLATLPGNVFQSKPLLWMNLSLLLYLPKIRWRVWFSPKFGEQLWGYLSNCHVNRETIIINDDSYFTR